MPGLALLRGQRGPALRRDVITGVVLAALLVPQGMGYAVVAGLPPVTGLYATLVPLLVYFLLGPSRILVLGPDSAVCPLVALAPIGPKWPPALARRISFVHWSERTTARQIGRALRDARGRLPEAR